MKTSVQQEILLVTGTTLSKRQLCKKNTSDCTDHFLFTEQLEDACWNGMLYELLPEVIKRSSTGHKLSLWQIRHGASFLEIELSECPATFEDQYSLNPYYFIWNISSN
jgi:hypothetical protein